MRRMAIFQNEKRSLVEAVCSPAVMVIFSVNELALIDMWVLICCMPPKAMTAIASTMAKRLRQIVRLTMSMAITMTAVMSAPREKLNNMPRNSIAAMVIQTSCVRRASCVPRASRVVSDDDCTSASGNSATINSAYAFGYEVMR